MSIFLYTVDTRAPGYDIVTRTNQRECLEGYDVAILLTGGAGYIGSHTCVELLAAGYEVVILDSLSNSKREVLDRLRAIAGKEPAFATVDLLDREAVRRVFQEHRVEAVIHFAGLKAVGEDAREPLRYYHNNITGTLTLCAVMQEFGVTRMVFSSSATVYGAQKKVPLVEDMPKQPVNPYGRTKAMIEDILADLHRADDRYSVAMLRYFNPVGAHKSGRIGEDPNGIPNNLMPYIAQVAVGKLKELSVFGDDYPTPDGTGVRDYIHVMDLAVGHVKALEWVLAHTGVEPFNLGAGVGYSVFDLVKAFERASGVNIPYRVTERRVGDVAVSYADAGKAERVLGWRAVRGLDEMCEDAWRWQSQNPNGYEN